MPRVKKAEARTPKKAEVIVTEANDTQLIIVILLLVLVYPLGLIFMWYWMRSWPTWLKVIISLPIAIAVIAMITGFIIAGLLVHRFATNTKLRSQWENQMRVERQKDASQGAIFYLTPTTTISPTSTPTY